MNEVLLDTLVAVLVPVIAVVGGMVVVALRKLAAKWGMDATAQNTANMESDLKAALNAGIATALPIIETKGWASEAVRSAVLGVAAGYLRQRFPARSAQIVAAAQPAGGAGDVPPFAAIKDTLAARLPEAIAIAAASPATPPATAPFPAG